MDARQLARLGRMGAATAAAASLAACASVQPHYAINGGAAAPGGPTGHKIGSPYQVGGVWYVPREQLNYNETGIASWYGDEFHLKPTADGEIFDMNAVSGAHTTLPLPSIVEVTNLDNGRKLRVRVNDRGPFVGGRIIDLSHQAARELGYDRRGLARVRVRYIGPAPIRMASAAPAPKAPPWTAPPSAAGSSVAAAASASADGAVYAAPALKPVEVAARPLAPLTGAELGPPRRPQPSSSAASPAPAPSTVAADAAPTGLRVQAGAFASRLNAERAVAQLAGAGQAVIEPMEHNGGTLFRVVLPAPSDEAEAYALRDQVAAIGFSDARVVQPF